MASQKPMAFFLERYAEAYRNELDAFVSGLQSGIENYPIGEDGRRALLIANAALKSLETGNAQRLALE
jgi:myo-inositol 2-dehydrogenase/D-chiro-inositol 1-dehydrogenase